MEDQPLRMFVEFGDYQFWAKSFDQKLHIFKSLFCLKNSEKKLGNDQYL